MTEERLNLIERYFMQNSDRYFRSMMRELFREIKRSRQSERICRAAAMIYKGREPVKLRRIA